MSWCSSGGVGQCVLPCRIYPNTLCLHFEWRRLIQHESREVACMAIIILLNFLLVFLSCSFCFLNASVIELELLAVAWAIMKCKLFLAGLPHFTVITDHHPLIPILNSHRLDEIENPRIQRLKARIMAYNFTAEWVKGTLNNAPDSLSWNPILDPLQHEMLAERDMCNNPESSLVEIRLVVNNGQENIRIQKLREHAKNNQEYQQLQKFIIQGFPEHRHQQPEECRRYWNVKNQHTMDNDLIVNGCRLVIPTKMRWEVLDHLHESNQGLVCTKQRAQLTVYWPGIDNDIDNVILACKKCQDALPSNNKEPLISKPKPERPFQEIAADFCSHGRQDYLVLVDCYTDWPDIIPMGHNTSTSHLIKVIRQSFCRTGVPDTLWSDQRPQFTSKQFQDFASQWGFQHRTSSPRYPQSNGKIEATVKSMKKLIKTSWNVHSLEEEKLARALLQYCNTPSCKDGLSPAQKLLGQPIQDTLPAHRRAISSDWQRAYRDSGSDRNLDPAWMRVQLSPSYCCSMNPRPCLLASANSRVGLWLSKNAKIGLDVSDALAVRNAWSCSVTTRTYSWCWGAGEVAPIGQLLCRYLLRVGLLAQRKSGDKFGWLVWGILQWHQWWMDRFCFFSIIFPLAHGCLREKGTMMMEFRNWKRPLMVKKIPTRRSTFHGLRALSWNELKGCSDYYHRTNSKEQSWWDESRPMHIEGRAWYSGVCSMYLKHTLCMVGSIVLLSIIVLPHQWWVNLWLPRDNK